MKQAERLGAALLWMLFAGLVAATAFVAVEVQSQTPAGSGQEAAPETTVKRIVIPRPGKAATKPPPSTTSEAKIKSEPAQRAQSSTSPRIKKIITRRKGKKPEERTLPDVSRPDPPKGGPKRKLDMFGGKLDMVLVKGRPPLQGRVVRLAGSMLLFSDQDQRTVPLQRSDLVLISFTIGQLGALPKLPERPEKVEREKDLVITYDGKAVAARVTTITDASVITEKTTFPRGKVNRILFAAEKPDGVIQAKEKDKQKKEKQKKNDGGEGTEKTPGGDGGGNGEGTTAEASRPAGATVKQCPKNKPLGGRLFASFVKRNRSVTSKVRLRLRFPLVYRPRVPGAGATWNHALYKGFDAPWMYYNLRMTNTEQRPGAGWDSCNISDGKVAGTANLSVGWDTDTYGRSGQVKFYPLAPSLSIVFPDKVEVIRPYHCNKTFPRGSSGIKASLGVSMTRLNIGPKRSWQSFIAQLPGAIAPTLPSNIDTVVPDNWVSSTAFSVHFGLKALETKCKYAKGSLAQECVTHPGRYALIPFVGDFFARPRIPPEKADIPRARVRFGVCCGCGGISDEQYFAEEDETDCLESAMTQGQVFDAEFISYERALHQAYKDLREAMSLAELHYSSWMEVMAICGLDDLIVPIANAYSALSLRIHRGPGGPVAWSRNQGPVYALPPSPGFKGPTGRRWGPPSFDPREFVLLNWKALEYLIIGYNLFKNGPTTAVLQDRLNSCAAKAPYSVSSLLLNERVTKNMYENAQKFVDSRDNIARLAKLSGKLGSDLIQLDIEAFSKMANLKARCIECAEEQGIDPKRCESLSRDLWWASQ